MTIEAMKQALAALTNPWAAGAEGVADAIIALRAAIEQAQEPVALPEKIYEFVPTPEPVKWHHPECEGECIACLIEQVVQEAYGSQGLGYLQRHLTSPQPSKPWVGLTDEEHEEIREQYISWTGDFFRCESPELSAYRCAIETKLREKNT